MTIQGGVVAQLGRIFGDIIPAGSQCLCRGNVAVHLAAATHIRAERHIDGPTLRSTALHSRRLTQRALAVTCVILEACLHLAGECSVLDIYSAVVTEHHGKSFCTHEAHPFLRLYLDSRTMWEGPADCGRRTVFAYDNQRPGPAYEMNLESIESIERREVMEDVRTWWVAAMGEWKVGLRLVEDKRRHTRKGIRAAVETVPEMRHAIRNGTLVSVGLFAETETDGDWVQFRIARSWGGITLQRSSRLGDRRGEKYDRGWESGSRRKEVGDIQVQAGRGGVQRRFVMRKHQRRKAEAEREKQNYYEKSPP
ncbi:hypothetical protein FIBSPDRAFT_940106 [Athelia psychrophila]|uniref:Uncharacterized protein n=1 Tax=Athelia psychrophila TaxID=1759441 RepID=A0A167WKF6_9AGAM|nr:hypothetical protein FIBSPDRAFT_940106 [Fibularhizoctonia sp. CBS 109695]